MIRRRMNNQVIYAAIMLIAGFGIPIMAALNARLGAALKSPVLAAIILVAVASITMFIIFAVQGFPKFVIPKLPLYFYLGGLFFVFYILSASWIIPKFGVGRAVFFVLLGQLIASAILDNTGALGATRIPLDLNRIISLCLMIAGVVLYIK